MDDPRYSDFGFGRGRECDFAGWFIAVILGMVLSILGPVRAAETSPAEKSSAEAAPPAVGSAKMAFDIPQAVFTWDRANTNAVDPFFPTSRRRYEAADRGKRAVVVMDIDTLAERFIFLRGISGPDGNQVALLNNQPLKVGEKYDLRLEDDEGQPRGQERLTVQLVHVVDNTVVIKVEGGTREHVKQVTERGRIGTRP
jgi:hypothetical protein